MCGIYGSTIAYSKDILLTKLGKMNHRGPDFSSIYHSSDSVILGHNRLSIIDLDHRSNQPFNYENISIVFNGEIYNFLQLKEILTERGHHFETTSDTEVVCAAYIEYGEKCVEKFNGMFAFVIHDKAKRLLFGSRDRLGKKPFYYKLDHTGFEFASQLSALEIGNQLELDDEALTKYLYWNYIPEPYTPYLNHFKLASAHNFTYNLDSKEFVTYSYWDLPSENQILYDDFTAATNRLDELLTDAVKLRMIADVPLGIFLSGGIDSSIVAALAQKVSEKPIRTFSIKFNEKGFDESEYAKQVADKLKTEHLEIQCTYDEGIFFIKNFCDYYDEPFADSSAIPSLLLSKYTRKEVTVALSGDGGDETFLGYNIYDEVEKRKNIYEIPLLIRKGISKLFFMVEKVTPRMRLIAEALRLKNIKAFYISYFKGLNTDWIKLSEKKVEYLSYLLNDKKSLMEAISDFDTKKYMNGDCITKVERASMAFSLEVRSPLMDYRIVEFARQIPTDFKFGDRNKKRILKEVLYKYLPKELFERKKMGFGMPLGIWFRTILNEHVYEVLNDSNLSLIDHLLNKDEFLRIVKEHMDGTWDHTPKIWKVMVLVMWIKSKEKYLIQIK